MTFDHMKTVGMIHSKEARGEMQILKKVGDNDYLVVTEDGVKCHAIYNPFVGMYYADDLYAVVKED